MIKRNIKYFEASEKIMKDLKPDAGNEIFIFYVRQ